MKNYFITLGLLTISCEGKFNIRSAPCADDQVRKGEKCIANTSSDESSSTTSNLTCIDPSLSDIKVGTKVQFCDGSIREGTLKIPEKCTKSEETNCITTSEFVSVEKNKIDPSKISLGTSIAGIAGTKRQIKQCRNAANLSYFDMNPVNSTKKLPNRITAYGGGNIVLLGWDHGLATNDPIQLWCSGGTGTTLAGGVVQTNTTYYALVVGVNTIQFQSTPSGGALSVTGTSGCSTHWVVSSPANGIADDTENIDDYNGFTSTTLAPQNSPWGSEYVCDQNNFKNVTGSAPLEASNTIPSNGNRTWTQIWMDELTGLYLTNVLYDASGNNRDANQVDEMCKSLNALNSAKGGTGWRLPTQKELLQLSINGISKVAIAGGTLENYFWTSTSVSYNISSLWLVVPAYGSMQSYGRNWPNYSALCVR